MLILCDSMPVMIEGESENSGRDPLRKLPLISFNLPDQSGLLSYQVLITSIAVTDSSR